MAKKKRLYKNKKDRMIGGVLAGVADYLNLDPTIVRLAWILITIFSVGVGIIAYLAAWLIIPEK